MGSNISAVIEKIISEVEDQVYPKTAEFETQVISYKSKTKPPKSDDIKELGKTYSQINIYNRDPKVKTWILKKAASKFERCGSDSPFTTAEREPFLEVHHLRRLADDGSDTVTNAVILCPNCHKVMHYGINKLALVFQCIQGYLSLCMNKCVTSQSIMRLRRRTLQNHAGYRDVIF